MNGVQAIELRRQVLDWRDKWVARIPQVLENEIPRLESLLDARIEQMSVKDAFDTRRFAERTLNPAFESWVKSKSKEVLTSAQQDLNALCNHSLSHDDKAHALVIDTTARNRFEAGVVGGSAGAAVVGIPAVAAFSTTSVGGALGLIGVTAVSWPVVVGGAAVIGTLALFSGKKAFGFRDKAQRELKRETSSLIRKALLPSGRDQESLASRLQDSIDAAARDFTEKLTDARKTGF